MKKISRWLTASLLAVLVACTGGSAPVAQWKLAPNGAYAADLTEDGRLAVVSTVDRGVLVWDLAQNAVRYQWQHKEGAANDVFLVRISASGTHAVTAGRNDFVIWDLETGKAVGYYSQTESSIRDIAISSYGRYVLIGRSDGKVEHVDLMTGRRLEFLGHTEKINSVDLSPNGRYALTGGNDYATYLWNTQSGQVIWRFNHGSRVSKVALDPKGRYAFTADSQSKANIWSLKDGNLLSQLKIPARQLIFSAVRFANDGKWLMTGSPARRLQLWDVLTGQQLKAWQVSARNKLRPSGGVIYSVALQDDNRIITASSSGLAEAWSVQ